MSKKKVRKSYPLEFKKKAIMLTTQEGVSVAEVAEELDISPQYLSKWRSELLVDSELEDAIWMKTAG